MITSYNTKKPDDPHKETIRLLENLVYPHRAWRGSKPPEYPAALLDPRTCAHRLLRQLYPHHTAPLDREQRDRDIYQRHQAGQSTEALSKAFNLSLQQIRRIIRRLAG